MLRFLRGYAMKRNRDALIAVLVALNALLLAALFYSATPIKAANAQAVNLTGNYMVVAGEIQDQFDALYMIDARAHVLHAFTYDRGRRQLEYIDARNLDRDFRHNED